MKQMVLVLATTLALVSCGTTDGTTTATDSTTASPAAAQPLVLAVDTTAVDPATTIAPTTTSTVPADTTMPDPTATTTAGGVTPTSPLTAPPTAPPTTPLNTTVGTTVAPPAAPATTAPIPTVAPVLPTLPPAVFAAAPTISARVGICDPTGQQRQISVSVQMQPAYPSVQLSYALHWTMTADNGQPAKSSSNSGPFADGGIGITFVNDFYQPGTYTVTATISVTGTRSDTRNLSKVVTAPAC